MLDELGGMDVDRVTGVEADDEGWRITVEVVETRRIPDTADIIAKYEVRAQSRRQVPQLPAARTTPS